ncbi:MAG: hydroxymethylbilane synthase, partial [candidate division Zixibacteria bacterium]|nr:hydroxymethylbilane synthase [candidate division Zixibacteria bacterium]
MKRDRLILGSRGSELALAQARRVRDALVTDFDVPVEIKVIKTTGDRIDHLSFDKMEGEGFFTKELEEALLAGQIDLAVHSLKDLMTTQPQGLKLGAVGYREDRRELLIIRKESRVDSGVLPVRPGGVVGTSSVRRKCQIADHNPTLQVKDLRGNIPTRVKKLRDGQYDAIVIAAAGVKRLALDLSDLEVVYLDPEVFLPTPGQGILGIQIRSDDGEVEIIVGKLGSKKDELEAYLERGLLSRFESGCSLPLGVYSQIQGDRYRLKAILGQKTNG